MYGTARATPYGYSLWEFAVASTGGCPDATGPDHPAADPPLLGRHQRHPAARNVREVTVLNRTNGRYPDSQVYWSFNGQTALHRRAALPRHAGQLRRAGCTSASARRPASTSTSSSSRSARPSSTATPRGWTRSACKLAMRLHGHDGYESQVGEARRPSPRAARPRSSGSQTRCRPSSRTWPDTGAVPDPRAGKRSEPSRPGGAYADYFTATRPSAGVTATTADIFGCAGTLAGNPGLCAGAEPAHRAAAGGAAAGPDPVLPGRPGELLRQVLARSRHQRPRLRLPLRRRRRAVLVHLATPTPSSWWSPSAGDRSRQEVRLMMQAMRMRRPRLLPLLTGYGTGEIEQTTSSTNNVYLDGNGHLVLKAISSGGAWTSARIEATRDDFQAPAGRQAGDDREIEQPNPANGLGYWPAFWALGSPMRTGGGWPQSGRDRHDGGRQRGNTASQTLHDSAGSSGHALIACPNTASTCQTGYHTYSVIVDRTNTSAETLQFLMDGGRGDPPSPRPRSARRPGRRPSTTGSSSSSTWRWAATTRTGSATAPPRRRHHFWRVNERRLRGRLRAGRQLDATGTATATGQLTGHER